MDFSLNSEQELLRDSARRYFNDDPDYAASCGRDHWPTFAELGWLAMLAPEAAGGLAATLEDISILCEEMGRGLCRAPFVGSALLPARIIERCDRYENRMAMMTAIADGSKRVALAIYEPRRRYALDAETTAVQTGDGSYRLSGSKCLIAGGAQATALIVSARLADASPALFLINTDSCGIDRRGYRTLDQAEVADCRFDDVIVAPAGLLVNGDATPAILQAALDEGLVCLCAEMLGGIDRSIELTVDYLKLRKQFGRTLADFQVLQHAVAEMSIDAGSARSILYRAIAAFAAAPAERGKAVSACAIKLMQAAKSVTAAAVHLHGAVGVTCELQVGHYLRRAVAYERLIGDREHHLARLLQS